MKSVGLSAELFLSLGSRLISKWYSLSQPVLHTDIYPPSLGSRLISKSYSLSQPVLHTDIYPHSLGSAPVCIPPWDSTLIAIGVNVSSLFTWLVQYVLVWFPGGSTLYYYNKFSVLSYHWGAALFQLDINWLYWLVITSDILNFTGRHMSTIIPNYCVILVNIHDVSGYSQWSGQKRLQMDGQTDRLKI